MSFPSRAQAHDHLRGLTGWPDDAVELLHLLLADARLHDGWIVPGAGAERERAEVAHVVRHGDFLTGPSGDDPQQRWAEVVRAWRACTDAGGRLTAAGISGAAPTEPLEEQLEQARDELVDAWLAQAAAATEPWAKAACVLAADHARRGAGSRVLLPRHPHGGQ